MTVKELKKELKQLPQTADVAIVEDWNEYDDFGHLTKTALVTGTSLQTYVECGGLDEKVYEEVIFIV